MTGEVPPWGTPDGEPAGDQPAGGTRPERGAPAAPPAGGVPDYGTPPPAPDRHGRHRAGRGTPAPASGWGAPPAGRADPAATGWGTPVTGAAATGDLDLLAHEQVVVAEQGGLLSAGGYDLLDPGGARLGSLVQETSVAGLIFGGAATTTYRLLDPHDGLVGAMLRPGMIGRSRFVVSDAGGTEVGTVEQENSFGTPRLLLSPAAGTPLRLTRPFGDQAWLLTSAHDPSVTLGRVSKEFAGLGAALADRQRFAITFSPALTGDHRLLAVLATVGLDYILDAKRR